MKKETKWSLDAAHSEISFKVRHLMVSHIKGSFRTFEANIYTTDKDFTTAEVDLWIDVNSVSTGDEQRDEHLKSAEFFDMANHKQISFTSSTIEQADANGNHELWGELTIKGITKVIKLNVNFGGMVHDAWGNEVAGFEVSGKINRSDFDLTWNKTLEAGGVMVSDEVMISCSIELKRAGNKDINMVVEPLLMESADGILR